MDSQSGETERRKNFLTVASRSSSEHKFYRRDLFSLMNLSVKCEEYGLALDLGTFCVCVGWRAERYYNAPLAHGVFASVAS